MPTSPKSKPAQQTGQKSLCNQQSIRWLHTSLQVQRQQSDTGRGNYSIVEVLGVFPALVFAATKYYNPEELFQSRVGCRSGVAPDTDFSHCPW